MKQKSKLKKTKNKKPPIFWNLLFNIFIPVIILIKLSEPHFLGPTKALILALFFPIIFAIISFYKFKDINFFSILGFISILLTGIIGIIQLPGKYIIIKETAIPLIIAVVILISQKTKYSFTFYFFNEMIAFEKIKKKNKSKTKSNQKNNSINKIINLSAYLLAFTFFISASLNYILAKLIIKSDPGTVEFNTELGKMLSLSFPVIALPAIIMTFFIVIFLITSIKKQTGLELEEIVR